MALAALAATVPTTFIGGVVSAYFFHRPQLNKEGFKILALRGLQGTVLTVASFCISASVLGILQKKVGVKSENEERVIFTAYVLCGVLITAAAKAFPNRLGTPTEALINFAVSSVLGYLAPTGPLRDL